MTSEPIGVTSSSAATNSYAFDANKLGVLTLGQWSGGLTNSWQETSMNALGQITGETWYESGLTLRSSGSAANANAVSATLDSVSVPNLVLGNGRWYADLSLSLGSHTLAATANYSVGNFSATATSGFTVLGTNTVTDSYDGAGNMSSRSFGSGKTQTLTWDGFGRLVGLTQRDSLNNGFNWSAIYDALGRRLRTINTPVVTNFVNSPVALTIDSYYDPQVEFQEVAAGLNGQRTWKVLGPDLNGRYGGMQGAGGLEATVRESDGLTTPVLNDLFGNVLATLSGSVVNWGPVRVGGYGPILGYQAPVLSLSTPLAEVGVWRSRRADPSGFFYMGARYYDPVAGHFLSPDPLGHSASMDLYSSFGGDGINNFDPDGRGNTPQISGFTYDMNAGRVVGVQYGTPGRGIEYGPPQWEWRGTWPGYSQDIIRPFDYNWDLQTLNDKLGTANYEWQLTHPVQPVFHPDEGRTVSADMDVVNAATVVSGARLVTGLAESVFGTPGFAFGSGAEGEQFIRDVMGGVKGDPIETSLGMRYPDVVSGSSMAEVKVGYQDYSQKFITQIEKDAEIVSQNLDGIQEGEWQFLRSSQTGEIGADPRLLDLIESKPGLSYTINSTSVLDQCGQAGLFLSGLGLELSGSANSGVILSKH